MKYYKFYLTPGQTPPNGTTSIAMPDGGIVWEGEIWSAKDIEAHEMSALELDEYKMLLKYQASETEFRITFNSYKDAGRLEVEKSYISDKMNIIIAAEKLMIEATEVTTK